MGNFTNDLFCLVLPLRSTNIIVPSLVVEEVVSHIQVKDHSVEPADWFLGYAVWRKEKIPVFSYELANGDVKEIDHHAQYDRIAVFKTMSVLDEMKHYAIIINDIPRVSKFKSGDLVTLNADAGVLSIIAVEAKGDIALIPNLDYLESCIMRRLRH